MTASDPDTTELIRRAHRGDGEAVEQLLDRNRDRLRRMVQVHLDRRLASRVDPSDVVQEAMTEAARRMPDYLRDRPVAFYPWLRQIAWERLVKLRQHHVATQKRSVLREQQWDTDLPDESIMELANRVVASGTSPSQHVMRDEMRKRVRTALEEIPAHERQVLVLRYLEQLPTNDAAQVMGITEAAFQKRHVRAIKRLRELLS